VATFAGHHSVTTLLGHAAGRVLGRVIMPIVVQKYGGSSVADIERLQRVADAVVARKQTGADLVVVVSAMGKTTDALLEQARRASVRGDGIACEPPRRELDMLVSTGERVSMSLLSIAIQARGCPAVSLTGSQSGIITNDRHFDARILEVRPHRIEDELARGQIVIVAGYQGMSYRREITTLGRGGSDTSAVALAAALGADCEIYSDVDGVYSADPRHVPNAQHLPGIDYETMQEMAECGAKVLNAQAVEWARQHRVLVKARRTGDGANSRETLLSGGASSTLAVVADEPVALISARSHELGRLVESAERVRIPLRDLSVRGDEVVAVAPLRNAPDPDYGLRALEREPIEALCIERGFGSLSLVGPRVGSDPRLSAAALGLLSQQPRWIVKGPLRLCALVAQDGMLAAERRWHEHFVASAA
jgi:aspartate kinase